jgi:hypothetical protein
MSEKAKIKQAIRAMVSDLLADNVLQGVVKSVDKTKKTITVFVEKQDIEYFDVRLMSLAEGEAGDGITIFPTVGSDVMICQIENIDTMYFVALYSVIESYEIKIGDIKLFMDENGIVFNGGSLGGMIKIETLKTELAKTNALLDAIKNVLTTWIPVPSDGGAALKAAATSALASLTSGDFSSIENNKVKH